MKVGTYTVQAPSRQVDREASQGANSGNLRVEPLLVQQVACPRNEAVSSSFWVAQVATYFHGKRFRNVEISAADLRDCISKTGNSKEEK